MCRRLSFALRSLHITTKTQGSAQYRQTIHHINKFQSINNILDLFLDLFLD